LRESKVNNIRNNKNFSLSKLLEISEIAPFVTLTLLILIFTFIDRFFISIPNLRIILFNASFTGIISLGMAMVFITGQFDLSAAGVAGISSMAAAYLMALLGWPVCIVSTLGMMFILIGAVTAITGGYGIYPLPESFNYIGKIKIFGISLIIIIFIIMAITFDFILRKTTFGRKVYTTGANVEVARLMGINTDLIKFIAYIVLSFLASLSGLLYMSTIRSGTPEIATDWILLIIAGVVIGGVSTFGGRGRILGVVMGILVVGVMRSGLTMIGARSEWQNVSIGIILILSTIFDYFRGRSNLSDE